MGLALGKQLTAEQRLSKAVYALMGHPQLVDLAPVLLIGERHVTDDPKIPTACTNGRDEWYAREFIDGLTDPQLRGLVMHENLHKLYKHLLFYLWMYKKHAQAANMACDYVINLMIDDLATLLGDGFIELPPKALLDRKYVGMDSVQVFLSILDDIEGGRSGGGDGEPLDTHDWENAEDLTDDERKELEREIDEAIQEGIKAAGKLGGGGALGLAELATPQVNWRDVLREFVQQTCAGNDFSTYARPNRRFLSAGVYMPSGICQRAQELVIAGDMSGSISNRERSVILGELQSVCDTVKPDKVRVLYWDTEVAREEEYDQSNMHDLAQSTKPHGGGGTDVRCVPEYMRSHRIKPQAAIVITDGYLWGEWGTWDCPVLWVVIDNKDVKPTVGKVIHVKSWEL